MDYKQVMGGPTGLRQNRIVQHIGNFEGPQSQSRYSFGGYSSPRLSIANQGNKSALDLLRTSYYTILKRKNRTDQDLRVSLDRIRLLVLQHGIPDDPQNGGDSICLRAKIWKILLCVYELSASQYASLVSRGACWQYEKIENDAFRTLATDRKFRERVHETLMLRVLNSFVLKKNSDLKVNTVSYVQGMNVLLAPFLYVMPELDAFHCFEALVTYICPTYVQPALEGVYVGLKLLDKCLEVCDPALHSNLAGKNIDPALYALPSILTLCACTPPLEEVLKLWDYYLCFGAHLNILAVLSQITSMRSALMCSDKPMNELRIFKPINSRKIIKDITTLFALLPKDIREPLYLHTHTQIQI